MPSDDPILNKFIQEEQEEKIILGRYEGITGGMEYMPEEFQTTFRIQQKIIDLRYIINYYFHKENL
jgi:hypothetical protein